MEKFDTMTGVAAPFPIVNCDTDKIIPARFLKTLTRTGLGKSLFDAMRYDPKSGEENPDFVLNKQAFASCIINHITMGKIHFESLYLDLKIRTCKFAFYARSLNTRLLTRRSSFQGLQPISLVINQLRWSCSYLTTDLIFLLYSLSI